MNIDDLLGESPAIVAVREQVARVVARGGAGGRLPPVLLQGETGTGKGLIARALHAASARRDGPFVDVNCAAIPEGLLEAEMFGVERGAFTGADRARSGLFQTAHRGTLFLDEIGLVPGPVQGKLLKAIEDRAVRRLGRTASEPVDAWIVAATSEDLDDAMRAERFRRDLYHRLAVVTLRLPPLRERGTDVRLLAERFLARVCADYRLPAKTFTDDAVRALQAHGWPGNVRELTNVVERAALLSEATALTAGMLRLGDASAATAAEPAEGARRGTLRDALESTERSRVLAALEQTSWNLSQAAALLQIPRNTLRYRMERLGLRPPPPSRRLAGDAPVVRRRAGGHATAEPSPTAAPSPIARPAPFAGGDRRRLSWLRAGLVGAEASAGEFDTSRALETIAEKVHGFGGEIQAVHRTHVTAVFGLEPVEDAPRRTALAALAVRNAAERARREGAWPWSVAISIHVHDSALKPAGAALGVEADDAQAAHAVLEVLSEAAPADSVVVSAAAATFLERRFDLAPPPRRPDAGPSPEGGPGAYHLSGPERAGFGLAGRVTAFVGRRQELALLEARLASAATGRGSVVAVVAEAGMGKSRLLFELRQQLDPRAMTYLEGRCYSYASAIPYFPMLDVVRQICRITEADGPAAIESKVRSTVEWAGDAARDASPYLVQLLGGNAEAELRGVNPALLKARTFGAIRQLMLAASARRPCVVVVEDLHWIDRTSDELLAALVESSAAAAMLLVATYRPGYQPTWLARSNATQVALAPLSSDESRTVLDSALAAVALAPEVAKVIVAKAEGNPFFLEELARAVGPHPSLGAVSVPDTIESVLMARVDRLADEDRRLLQAAAVIGRDVPVSILAAVADETEAVLHERLRRLQAAEFLHETRLAPAVEYAFKHALTHEVAYGSVPPEQRRDLHARAGQALTALSPDAAERRPETVARHLTAAEKPAEAIPYWLKAGRAAIRRSAPVEAASHLRAGLDLLTRMPASRARDRQELELQVALGPALVMTSGYAAAEVQHVHARARALAQELAELPALISASSGALGFHLVRGDQRAAHATAEELLALAQRSGSAELLVEAHFALGVTLHYRGRFDDARVQLARSIALHDPRRDAGHAFEYGQDPWVGSHCYLAYGRALQGEEAESLRFLEDALRGAEKLGHPFTLGCALHFAAMIHELRREFAAARAYAERESEIAREHRFPFWLAGGTQMRGRVLAVEGRLDEGLRLMQEGLAIWKSTGAALALPYYLSHLADAHLAAGRVDLGLATVAEGLAIAERNDERNYVTELHRLRAMLLASDPARWAEAEAAFEEAVSVGRQQRSHVLANRAAASFAAHVDGKQRTAD